MKILNFFGKPVILASQSPRRIELLKMIGVEFTVHPSNYSEFNDISDNPPELAMKHALCKAQQVAKEYDNAWIIGADTIVALESKIFGKPQDRDEAIQMLKELSGKTHKVFTAYCILNSDNGKYLKEVVATKVRFRPLNQTIIEYYIDNYPPYDKAGAYGIQDFSAIFVERIDGCFYNVVGFPIAHFYHLVRRDLKKIL